MCKKIIFLLMNLLLVSLAFGQKLMLTNIEETRTTNSSWDACFVEVKLIGDEARNYSFYRINEITSAVDNKGINLIREADRKPDFVPVTDNLRIELMKASRSATDITITGTMTLYKPTEANGGLVKVSGFRSKPGVNIAPKGSLFSLYYYDRATLEKRSKIDPNQRRAEIDKLSGKERDLAEELEFLVQGISYYSEDELEKSVYLIVGGDSNALVGIDFESGNGKPVRPSSSYKSNLVHNYYFDNAPEANMKLVLNIENPKAAKVVPFTLKGIDLP